MYKPRPGQRGVRGQKEGEEDEEIEAAAALGADRHGQEVQDPLFGATGVLRRVPLRYQVGQGKFQESYLSLTLNLFDCSSAESWFV